MRLSQRAVEQGIVCCFGGIGAGLQRIERLQDPSQQTVRLRNGRFQRVDAVLRTVEERRRHETAHRLRATIGEVFRYAIATGRATADPTYSLRGALTQATVTHRPAITDPIAFGALLRPIAGYDGAPETRIALQLLALTFVRPGELRNATWSEFDRTQHCGSFRQVA